MTIAVDFGRKATKQTNKIYEHFFNRMVLYILVTLFSVQKECFNLSKITDQHDMPYVYMYKS